MKEEVIFLRQVVEPERHFRTVETVWRVMLNEEEIGNILKKIPDYKAYDRGQIKLDVVVTLRRDVEEGSII